MKGWLESEPPRQNYLLQLWHTRKRSFCPLSSHTVLHWAIIMFFNCSLVLPTNITSSFFIIRSDAMSFNKVHSEAWTIMKNPRTSGCRTLKRSFAFSLCKCLYRRTNLFHGGRHVLNCGGCEKTGVKSIQVLTLFGRRLNMADNGRWKEVQYAEKKTHDWKGFISG